MKCSSVYTSAARQDLVDRLSVRLAGPPGILGGMSALRLADGQLTANGALAICHLS